MGFPQQQSLRVVPRLPVLAPGGQSWHIPGMIPKGREWLLGEARGDTWKELASKTPQNMRFSIKALIQALASQAPFPGGTKGTHEAVPQDPFPWIHVPLFYPRNPSLHSHLLEANDFPDGPQKEKHKSNTLFGCSDGAASSLSFLVSPPALEWARPFLNE